MTLQVCSENTFILYSVHYSVVHYSILLYYNMFIIFLKKVSESERKF